MTNFLSSLVMKFSMLGAWQDPLKGTPYEWLIGVFEGLDTFLVPLLIAVATAGMIYAVYLGINMIRAEDTGKREEAKKRLIWAVIGIVVIIAGIALLYILRENIGNIMGFVK